MNAISEVYGPWKRGFIIVKNGISALKRGLQPHRSSSWIRASGEMF